MSTPLDTNYTRIANDLLEALASTKLPPYEWRVLMYVFRMTYGYQRKSAKLDPAEIARATGISRQNVCRARRGLAERNIVVITDNEIGINKYHTQWRALSVLTTPVVGSDNGGGESAQTTNVVGSDNERNKNDNAAYSLPTTAPHFDPQHEAKKTPPKERKENYKEKSNVPSKKTLTPQEVEQLHVAFDTAALTLGCTDEPYLQKLWPQGLSLRGEHRMDFLRKAALVVRQVKMAHPAALKLARRVYHEMAGDVNDRGEMMRKLSGTEAARRQQFAQEEYGKKYVEDELQPAPHSA